MGKAPTGSASEASKVAKPLKSPKTPKADKFSKATKENGKSKDRLATGLDSALVERAVGALLKFHEKTSADKVSLLGTDQPIQVQFTLLRAPGRGSSKPIRVLIPHPLFKLADKADDSDGPEEPEICLIVKEESKELCQLMIEKFPEHMGCVKKVLGLRSLREKHASYEQRRELLNKYNFFMADERILPMLLKALGSDFSKAKKLPIPINLTRKEALPFAIRKALSATYMTVSTGTCVNIRAGYTGMSAEKLAENIAQIAKNAVPKMPHKWSNVQNICIKTAESVALPIYNKTPELLREVAKLAGFVEEIDTPETDEVPKDENETVNDKKRDLKSPLHRALKKQKQEEKKKSQEKKAQEEEKKQKKDEDKPVEKETPKQKKRRASSEGSKEDAEQASPAKKKKGETPESTKKAVKKQKEVNTPTKEDTKPTSQAKKKKVGTPESTKKAVKKESKTPESTKKATRKPESETKKKDADDDGKKKEFIATKKFDGSKKGYVFKMGKQGVGYYIDAKPVVDRMAMEAIARLGKGNGKGGQKKNKKGGRRSF